MAKDRRKLTRQESRKVQGHLKKIQSEHKELRQYLESIDIKPVGGWPSGRDYGLVKGGIVFQGAANCEEDCNECSVVCFDNSCDCTVEPAADGVFTVGPLTAKKGLIKADLRNIGIELQVRAKR